MKIKMGGGIEEVLYCKGYYGFGGGYLMAVSHQKELYCNRCPEAQPCWDKHRLRTKRLFPTVTEAFDRLVAMVGTEKAIPAWYNETQTADPYIAVMGGNIEDGGAVALTGKVKPRGEGTLVYPFKKEVT